MDAGPAGPSEAATHFGIPVGTVLAHVHHRKKSTPAAAVYVPLAQLQPWSANPRRNEQAVRPLVDSIIAFGWGNPILARQDNGEIIGGHTRLKAALWIRGHWDGLDEAGRRLAEVGAPATDKTPAREPWSKDALDLARSEVPVVPVRYLPLDEARSHALALADNRLGEIAEWDDAGLKAVLAELPANYATAAGFGVATKPKPADVPDPGAPALPVGTPDSQVGRVYQLGPHRLACGDSGDPAVWDALLVGEKVQMVWTDPPYGVSYVGGTGMTIMNDSLSPDDLGALLRRNLGALLACCLPGACWYVAAPGGPLHQVFGGVLLEFKIWRQSLVWVKDRFVLGRGDYHGRHEPVFFGWAPGDVVPLDTRLVDEMYPSRNETVLYGWAPGAAHLALDDRTQDTVQEFPRPTASADHPTMKPPELVRAHIRNSSRPGWIVADAFAGSGTTLIASAMESRVARVVELDPKYCDAIRRRWTRWAKDAGVEVGSGGLDG